MCAGSANANNGQWGLCDVRALTALMVRMNNKRESSGSVTHKLRAYCADCLQIFAAHLPAQRGDM